VPFDCAPSGFRRPDFEPAAELIPDLLFTVVRPLMRRLRLPSANNGLLLRVRARLSGSELEPSASSSIGGGEVTLRVARDTERVTGPK
jgi:hypothetical protein